MLIETRNGVICVSDILESASDVVKTHIKFCNKYSQTDLFKADYFASDIYFLVDYLSKKILLNDITPAQYHILCHMMDFFIVEMPLNILWDDICGIFENMILLQFKKGFNISIGELQIGIVIECGFDGYNTIHIQNDAYSAKTNQNVPTYTYNGIQFGDIIIPESNYVLCADVKYEDGNAFIDKKALRKSIVSYCCVSSVHKKKILDTYMNYIKRKQNEKN